MAADAAVVFLLEQVTGVIKGYTNLISGSGKEFKLLQADVELLKAHLEEISKKASTDHKVLKKLQDEVREIIYDVEDTIDSWLTRAAELKETGKVDKCFAKWLSSDHLSLAKDVKSLREGRVKEMFAKIVEMGSAVGTTKEAPVPEPKRVLIRQEKLVQFGDAEKIIIGYLTRDQKELDIIPITGMPGMGKTTIAWKIFKDKEICSAFQMRIWVTFSETFNLRRVLLKIMNEINQGNNDVSNMDDQELGTIVHECLKEKNFLLVFDDVWEEQHWDDIRYALPYSNWRGKVLVTSRHRNVGKHAQNITPAYELPNLKAEEGWKLLQFEVFGDLESCPEELEPIGKHIAVVLCKGLPLMIMLMGGVLRDHYKKLEKALVPVGEIWQQIAGDVNIAFEQREKVVEDALAMSYNNLPDYLRECFLYLGLFPEDYEIPSWTLTSLWIAEGFIKPHEKKSLEEVAKNNLDELISRNLLMALKVNAKQEVKVCGVHDMVRVFCRKKALSENLFQEIKMMDNEVPNETLVSDMEKIRRLCLHSNLSTFFSSNLIGPHVRSFLSFRDKAIDLEPKFEEVIFDNFDKLRILQSKSIKFKQFPKSIVKLIHLRYIVLCVDNLNALPETLSQLWNLQTIIIDTRSDFIKMEANIWQMVQLRHVKTKATIGLDDKWEGVAGKNIQILNRLSSESVTTAFSQKASNLKTLGIHGKLANIFDNMPLGKLNHLEKLKLYHAVTENRLQKFPEKKCFPPNLKRLTLSNTYLDWKHMQTLAMMDDLEVLKLKNNAFNGISWKADNGFKKLEFLFIDTTDLVLWYASGDAFPRLGHLALKACKNLSKIPDHILQNLKNLEIENISKSTSDCVRNSKAQFKLSVGPGCDM